MNRKVMRMSDLEKATGVNRSAIHNYLKKGLLSAPRKTGATMSYYDERHIKEVRMVRKLLEEGYPLAYIKEIMRDPGKGGSTKNTSPAGVERKQEIIRQATGIFARKGYHQAKIGDIAHSIGIGQSTFYLYFEDKRALFIECLDEVFRSTVESIRDEIKDERDPLKRIRKRAKVTLESHPQFFDILDVMRTMVEDSPNLKRRRREIYEAIAEPNRKDLEMAMEQGSIPTLDIRYAAFVLIGFIETASLLLELDKTATIDGLLDSFEKMLLSTKVVANEAKR